MKAGKFIFNFAWSFSIENELSTMNTMSMSRFNVCWNVPTKDLFGAGSGTILTKITKYAAAIFFVLAVLLSVMQTHYSRRTATNFSQRLSQAEPSPSAVLPPASAPTAAPTNNAAVTNAATASNTAFQLESTTQITNAPVSNRPPAGATNP